MIRRLTVEIDEGLLGRAQRALGTATMRATVEEALRRVVSEHEARAASQRRYFERLALYLDLEVLKSDEMWR